MTYLKNKDTNILGRSGQQDHCHSSYCSVHSFQRLMPRLIFVFSGSDALEKESSPGTRDRLEPLSHSGILCF